jgi:myo-inositol-1(or 4)-monophosphatase
VTPPSSLGRPAGPDVDPGELLALAERAARDAGRLIWGGRPARVEVAATKSSPTDVVTAMDTASEALLRARLSDARPHDGMHGEEKGRQAGTSGLTWVIDPIDGTVNYLYGIPVYAVCVAAVVGDTTRPGEWEPVAGVVHSPASGQTWTAAAGRGAFLNGRRLPAQSGPPPELAAALVGTGFGYLPARRTSQSRVLAALLPRVRDIRRMGSAAMDLCMVADGRLDGYYERGLQVWDLAAAMLVAREAGAVVRGIDQLPPHDHMVVAARSPLVDILVDELEALRAGADDGG